MAEIAERAGFEFVGRGRGGGRGHGAGDGAGLHRSRSNSLESGLRRLDSFDMASSDSESDSELESADAATAGAKRPRLA